MSETPYPGDDTAAPLIPIDATCPKARLHTRDPHGYVARHAWAERKARRHYQVRCPGCGYLRIWRRKPKDAP